MFQRVENISPIKKRQHNFPSECKRPVILSEFFLSSHFIIQQQAVLGKAEKILIYMDSVNAAQDS